MEGLEISELKLSAVREHNEKLRIDSGYFAKPMLRAEVLARSYHGGHTDLGALFGRFAKGIFEINADVYTETGVPFVRIGDLRAGMIDERGVAFIPEEVHAAELKTELRRGDIVLSKTAYPAAALVTFARGNTSQDTIAARLSDDAAEAWRPELIVAYLGSALGQRLMWRQFQGNVQLHLSLDDARKVPIPRFGRSLQAGIAHMYVAAEQALRTAERESIAAEAELLTALGLTDWNPARPLHYTRSSGEAFAAGRLDADYFSPRVHELMGRLGQDGRTLADIATVRREVFLPQDAGAFDYIEIGGVGADGGAKAEPTPHAEAPSRAAWIVRAGDVITSMVRPVRRLSAQIAADQDGAVCSSGFVVLQPTALPPEVLLTYLRLPLVCEVMDLHTSASLYPAISEAELLRLPVPTIDADAQRSIISRVNAVRTSRKRAHALLAAAQRAVELAIEESEEHALQHLRRAEKLNRDLPPLEDAVRVLPVDGMALREDPRVDYIIPASVRSKDDEASALTSIEDVLSVIDSVVSNSDAVERKVGVPDGHDPLAATTTSQAAQDPQAELLKDPRNVPLWFGTNREPVDRGDIGRGFSGKRSADQTVWHGRCIVNVPDGHALGSTGTGGISGWWQRWRHGVDDRLRVLSVEPLADPDFWQAVSAAMGEPDERKPEALLFLHGYRVTFEDAALRAAQLAYDLKIRDAAFFSWPSAGATAKYPVDEGSAKNATEPLAEFISELDASAHAAGKALHIIAHSMGNRVLLAALERLVLSGRTPKAIDKIVCAAPDEDAADFVKAMTALRVVGRRRTLYASSKDKPVWLSEVLHGYPRAGSIPPVTLAAGLDTVDASDLDATFLGHSDFATQRPLLQDLFSLIKSSLEPQERLGLERALTDVGAQYWRIK